MVEAIVKTSVRPLLYNRTNAARRLGMSYETLYRREKTRGGVYAMRNGWYHDDQIALIAAVELGDRTLQSASEEWDAHRRLLAHRHKITRTRRAAS